MIHVLNRLTRSSRVLWIGVLLTFVALLASLGGLYSLVYRDWVDEQRDSLVQELLWLDQSLRLHLDGHVQTMEIMATEVNSDADSRQRFAQAAALMRRESRELIAVQWVDPRGKVVLDAKGDQGDAEQLGGVFYDALWRAERFRRSAFGVPYRGVDGKYYFDLAVPVMVHGRYQGGLRAVYSMEALLHHQVPWWIASQYHISLVDLGGSVLASKFGEAPPAGAISHEINFDPPGFGVSLRAVSYRTGVGLALPVLSGLIAVLVLSLAIALWLIKRHVRERSNAERALQREMRLRQAIEDSMKNGLLVLNLHGEILRVNKAFCELTGFEATSLQGCRPPFAFWPVEDIQLWESALRSVLKGDLPAHGFELPFAHQNGDRFEVRFYATPLRDSQGRHTGWVASLYDITELKKKRLALNDSHRRFLTVLNGLDMGVCVVAGDGGQLLYANPAFGEMWADFDPVGAYCPLLPSLPDMSVVSRVPHEFSPDAGRSWYQLQYRRISWVDEEEAWLVMLADISLSRKQAELSLAQEQKLQATSRLIAMGEMASSLAHELNQPLTAISTYAAGVSRRLSEPVQQQFGVRDALQALVQQSRRAGQIVNSIRAFVKKRAPQLEKADPDRAVRIAVEVLQPQLEKGRVRVQLQLGDAVQVLMDPVLIEQVLINLIKNAAEALEGQLDPVPTVQISSWREGGRWHVRVSDNGPGLGEGMLENLFTPFFSSKSQGMGIGLNICRSIVEFHRGEFGVDDTQQRGCAFYFSLPLA